MICLSQEKHLSSVPLHLPLAHSPVVLAFYIGVSKELLLGLLALETGYS